MCKYNQENINVSKIKLSNNNIKDNLLTVPVDATVESLYSPEVFIQT